MISCRNIHQEIQLAKTRANRRLAAIMAADVVGYSRLMGEDETGTLARLKTLHKELVQPKITEFNGRIVKLMGDGLLAEFPSAVEALECGVEIQESMATRDTEMADSNRIRLRVGINLGDIIVEGSDIYGDGVNVASRLEGLADSGGICISDAVRTATGNNLPLEFEFMGEQSVKNIKEPIRAYQVQIQADDIPRDLTQESSGKPSIVVLPFKNISGDPEQEYFADGITEEIITGLGHFQEIIVVARGSSFLFKGKSVDPMVVARRLDVEYVLEGTVRKGGNQVRIMIQLISGLTGNQVCAERYDRELNDIFEVQDDVTQKIVTMLAGRLEEQGQARALRKNTANLSAYDYWLRGKYYLHDWKGSREDMVEAREMFERAIELDPGYAAAYAGLAGAYVVELENGWTPSREAICERALELARKAVSLDERDSWVHLVLAFTHREVTGNFELAEAQVRTAITCSGDLEEGIFCGNEAIRRNPLLPDACLNSMVFAEYLAGRYDKAIDTFCRMSNPGTAVQGCLAACYAQLGRHGDARRAADDFRKRTGDKFSQTVTWNDYWASYCKFKDPSALEHLLEGMNKAGLPG
jgi:adenylate cyclase